MASAWGSSWGGSWANAWGTITPPSPGDDVGRRITLQGLFGNDVIIEGTVADRDIALAGTMQMAITLEGRTRD